MDGVPRTKPHELCECYDLADAKIICDALNKGEKK
jgi:hypothetical protein